MLDSWLNNLKTNLKRRRSELDLTQQELANKSKLSMATIHKIEQGRSEDMKFSVLEALGKGLGEKDPLQLLKKPE